MRRIAAVPMVAGLALLLTGCFSLYGFFLLDPVLLPGERTKASFMLRPFQVAEDKSRQFVVVGVPTSGELGTGRATWGADGRYGGPVKMPVSSGLPAALDASGFCVSNGLEFGEITGIKWKGYVTPSKVNDHGNVNQGTVATVQVKAKASATTDENYTVFGVTGMWNDDGNGVPEAGDGWWCTGLASVALYVDTPV